MIRLILTSILLIMFLPNQIQKKIPLAVALNYLDPSKGFNMAQSEVVERMNIFLEKMQVEDREEL